MTPIQPEAGTRVTSIKEDGNHEGARFDCNVPQKLELNSIFWGLFYSPI